MRKTDLLTITQAAEQYGSVGVDRQTIAYACQVGAIKTVKRRPKARSVGAPIRYRIRRDELERWINDHIQAVSGPPDGHVEVKQASEQCKVSTAVIYEAIRSGQIPSIKRDVVGRGRARSRIYVRPEDVDEWRIMHGSRRFASVSKT